MSNYTQEYSAGCINLSLIRIKIQESLDNGLDDDETSIKNLVRYYVAEMKSIEVEYMRQCRLYSVRFSTVDNCKNEYQYRLFVKSHRPR